MELENSEIPQDATNGIIYLNISLYFAILAFFIVLNVLSTNNAEKSGEIVKSVKREFSETTPEKGLSAFYLGSHADLESSKKAGTRDNLTGFIDAHQQKAPLELRESQSAYTLTSPDLYFFANEVNQARDYFNQFSRDLSDFIIQNQQHTNAYAYLVIKFGKKDAEAEKKALTKLRSLQDIMDKNLVNNIKLSAIPADSVTDEKDNHKILIIFGKNDF